MNILAGVKVVCIVPESSTVFDPELLIYTNSAFGTVSQLGVPLPEDFEVDQATEWPDFPSTTIKALVIEFVGKQVRSSFDAPTNQVLSSASATNSVYLQDRIIIEMRRINAINSVEDIQQEESYN